ERQRNRRGVRVRRDDEVVFELLIRSVEHEIDPAIRDCRIARVRTWERLSSTRGNRRRADNAPARRARIRARAGRGVRRAGREAPWRSGAPGPYARLSIMRSAIAKRRKPTAPRQYPTGSSRK